MAKILKICEIDMAWAAKRLANEPLTSLFIGPLTARFNLFLSLGHLRAAYNFLKFPLKFHNE